MQRLVVSCSCDPHGIAGGGSHGPVVLICGGGEQEGGDDWGKRQRRIASDGNPAIMKREAYAAVFFALVDFALVDFALVALVGVSAPKDGATTMNASAMPSIRGISFFIVQFSLEVDNFLVV